MKIFAKIPIKKKRVSFFNNYLENYELRNDTCFVINIHCYYAHLNYFETVSHTGLLSYNFYFYDLFTKVSTNNIVLARRDGVWTYGGFCLFRDNVVREKNVRILEVYKYSNKMSRVVLGLNSSNSSKISSSSKEIEWLRIAK